MPEFREFKLPDVGEGLTEAEIITWKVKRGDAVKVNDIIVEIETAKSLVELPSPFAGVVADMLAGEGETVAVGTPIFVVDVDPSGSVAPAPIVDVPAAAPVEDMVPQIERPAEGEPVEPGLIGGPAPGGRTSVLVGYGPRETSAKRRPRKAVATTSGAPAAVPASGAALAAPASAPAPASTAASAARAASAAASTTPAPESAAAPAATTVLPPAIAGTTSSAGTSGSALTAEVLTVGDGLPTAPVRTAGGATNGTAAAPAHNPLQGRSGPTLAKPPVRKLAKDLGVDLATVPPSGPNGTVTRADIEAAAAGPAPADVVATPSNADAPADDAPVNDSPANGAFYAGQRETRVPVKGVRKMTAQAMVSSAFTAPHVTEFVTVDVTRTMKLVERLRSHRDFRDARLSPMLILAKAMIIAIRRTPAINSAWDEASQEIVLKHYVNLGIAAATPRGLVVPNIRDADAMSLRELADAVTSLVATAREGRTPPEAMQRGTITITNVGVFGIDTGTPIINPGETAIVALGAIREQPWVVRGKIRPRWVTTVAVSFDHRVIDGAEGSQFLSDVAAVLEDPSMALAIG